LAVFADDVGAVGGLIENVGALGEVLPEVEEVIREFFVDGDLRVAVIVLCDGEFEGFAGGEDFAAFGGEPVSGDGFGVVGVPLGGAFVFFAEVFLADGEEAAVGVEPNGEVGVEPTSVVEDVAPDAVDLVKAGADGGVGVLEQGDEAGALFDVGGFSGIGEHVELEECFAADVGVFEEAGH